MHHKILFVIPTLELGGAENHLARLCKTIDSKHFNCSVANLTSQTTLGKTIEPYAKVYNLYERPENSFFGKTKRSFVTLYKLIKLIRKERPDIVHFFLPKAYLLGMLAIGLTSHKPITIMSRRSMNYYQQKLPLYGKLERYLHKKITAATGNSQRVIQQLKEEGVDSSKLHCIYNGIDTPAKSKKKKDEASMVILANLIPYKGHLDLLTALSLVKQELPKTWKLSIIGEDRGIQKSLTNFAKEHGIDKHLTWHGKVTAPLPLLQTASIGILSSHEEGFSNAILEYMSAELAIVATDVGGNQEAVDHNKGGFIVPPKDPQALGYAISNLINNKASIAAFARHNKDKAQAVYTLSYCTKQYETLYTSLLSGTCK